MTVTLAMPLQDYRYNNPGASEAARYLNDSFGKLQRAVFKTGRFRSKLVELDSAIDEASTPDWDGHGGAVAKSRSCELAFSLLSMLPDGIAKPEFSVDPDGEIEFEWYVSKSRLVSITIGDDGKLYYVGFLGNERKKGAVPFDPSHEIPKAVLEILGEILR